MFKSTTQSLADMCKDTIFSYKDEYSLCKTKNAFLATLEMHYLFLHCRAL